MSRIPSLLIRSLSMGMLVGCTISTEGIPLTRPEPADAASVSGNGDGGTRVDDSWVGEQQGSQSQVDSGRDDREDSGLHDLDAGSVPDAALVPVVPDASQQDATPPSPGGDSGDDGNLQTARARISGTLNFFTYFVGSPTVAPMGNLVQVSYFKTTDQNEEIRRGIFEFAESDFEPAPGKAVVSARLVLASGSPISPAQLLLTAYDADVAFRASDYERAGTQVFSFDAQELNFVDYHVDVTELIASARSRGVDLGFRLQFVDEHPPINIGFEILTPVEIELRLVDAPPESTGR